METLSASDRSVIVVGGGISGLAAAHRLYELDPTLQLTLLEASSQLGGVLQTERVGEYLIEKSADSFITNIPWAINLCNRVGLGEELQGTDETRRKALVVCRGKLQPVPDGFMLMQPKRCWPVLASPILSLRGKLRLACEAFIRPRLQTSDESLASFVRRRLGNEAFDRLVQPLVGGIYTADPEQLSMAATLGRFQELERRHGSLIRAAWSEKPKPGEKSDSGARYSMFVAPRNGLSSLVTAIANRLPTNSVRLNASVQSMARNTSGSWCIKLATGETCVSKAVVLAAPAQASARLLTSSGTASDSVAMEEIARELGGIDYAGASVVVIAVRKKQITFPLTGFGFVVPAIEGRKILAGSFASLKFAGRCPSDQVLIRVFVGGALQPKLADLPDDELLSLVQQELAALIGLRGEPILAQVNRWTGAMPQYHVGHLDRVARIEQLTTALPGLALAGNAYRGVGIPQCIHSGEQAAEQIMLYLKDASVSDALHHCG